MVRHLFHKVLLCLLLLIAGWSIAAQNNDYQRFKKNWEYLQQFYSPDEHAIFQVLDTMEKAAPQPYKGVYNFLIAQCLWQEVPYHADGNGQPRDGLREVSEWSKPEMIFGCARYADSALTQLLEYGWVPAEEFDFLSLPGNIATFPGMTLYDLTLMCYIHTLDLQLQSWFGITAKPEWFDKAIERHKVAGHHKILIEYELCRLLMEDNDAYRGPEKSQYWKRLLNLERKYGPEAAIEYEKGMCLYEFVQSNMTNVTDSLRNSWITACKECFESVLTNATDSFYRHNASQMLTWIRRPELKLFEISENLSPAPKILVPVTYRNVETLYVSVFRYSQRPIYHYLDKHDLPHLYELIQDKELVRQQRFTLPNPTPHCYYSTDLFLDSLPIGDYILVYHTQPEIDTNNILSSNEITITNIQISEVVCHNRAYYTFTDNRTGEPLRGLRVTQELELFDRHYRTDRQGRISVRANNDDYFMSLTVQETPDHKVSINMSGAQVPSRWEWDYDDDETPRKVYFNYRDNHRPMAKVILDRELYRPGQTVYYKAYMVDGKRVLTNRRVIVSLRNRQNKTVYEVKTRTNRYGTVSGSIQLPPDSYGMLDLFVDAAGNWDVYCNTSLEVAAYKLPTFRVEFDDIRERLALGDTVPISGRAVTFTGEPVRDAQVAITIKPPYERSGTVFARHLLRTDAEGRFHVDFPTQEEGSERGGSLWVEVTADVTDLTGETHSAEKRISLQDNSFIFYATPSFIEHENGDTLHISYHITDWTCDNCEEISVRTEICRLDVPDEFKPLIYPKYRKPSNPIFTEKEYRRYFPDYSFTSNDPRLWPALDTVYTHEEQKSGRYITKIDAKDWPAGTYKLRAVAVDSHGRSDTTTTDFLVFNTRSHEALKGNPLYMMLDSHDSRSLNITVGSTLKNVLVYCDVFQQSRKIATRVIKLDNEQKTITQHIQKKPRVKVLCYTTQNSKAYTRVYQLFLADNLKYRFKPGTLELNLVRWNSLLTPGEKTRWEMEVRNVATGKHEPSEVQVWMVDSSLIALDDNKFDDWILPYEGYYRPAKQIYFTLNNIANNTARPRDFRTRQLRLKLTKQYPIYALDRLLDTLVIHPPFATSMFRPDNTTSSSRLSGENVRIDPGRAISHAFQSPFEGTRTVVDGVRIREKEEFPDDFTAGSDAAHTGHPIQIRSRFEETAFFYPNLYTDKAGRVAFDFTLPDQLTTWQFYAIAFTPKQHAGRLSGSVVSKLPFMLQTHAPRLLRKGDTFDFSAKVFNASDKDLHGKITLAFFDASDSTPVCMIKDTTCENAIFCLISKDSVDFHVAANATQEVHFSVMVLEGAPDAVIYRIVALCGEEGNAVGDGEEKMLPVLSNRMLVTEAQHFVVPPLSDTAFLFERFRNDALILNRYGDFAFLTKQPLRYTVEATTNPAWLVLQSLPSLMRYPHECNEQLFSKLFAAAIVRRILNQNPGLADIFEQWRNDTLNGTTKSPLLRNEALQSILLEETPWLCTAQNESRQRTENAKLFNHSNLDQQLTRNFNKLLHNQLKEGGWDWYGSYRYSPYITDYLIAGFYKLQRLGIDLPNDTERMLSKALQQADRAQEERYQDYLDAKKEHPATTFPFREEDVHYLYARSFTPKDTHWLAQPYVRNLMDLACRNIQKANYMRQAEMALVLYRTGRTKEAQTIVESLRKQAFRDREKGMYWGRFPGDHQRDWRVGSYYRWYEAPVERQAMLIEAFAEISPKEEELSAMKQWILLQKESHGWSSTKASSAAIYALLLNAPQALFAPANTVVTVGDEIVLTGNDDGAEAGTGYQRRVWETEALTPQLADIAVRTDSVHPTFGACYYQYLDNPDQVTASGDGLTIQRTLLHQPSGNSLTAKPVTTKNPAHIGERITVRLVVSSDRELEYVHVKDPRAAGFEPVNIHEQRKGSGGVWWVESPREAATHFFLDRLPQGTTVIEYDVFATQSGTFSQGATTVECMYAPAHNAHCGGEKVTVLKP